MGMRPNFDCALGVDESCLRLGGDDVHGTWNAGTRDLEIFTTDRGVEEANAVWRTMPPGCESIVGNSAAQRGMQARVFGVALV